MIQSDDGLGRLNSSQIYHHFLSKKASGAVFDWALIAREDLRRLSWDYDLSDAWIGEIYGVSKRQVTAKRAKWDLQLRRRMVPTMTLELAKVLDDVSDEMLRGTAAAASYESRFPGSNGSRWHLALKDGQIRITRSVDGSPETTWTCDIPDDARSLMQQIGHSAVLETAASAEESTIILAPLDEREVVWLEGSLRTALALWE